MYCADCEAELSRTPVTGEVDPNTHTGNTNEVTENEQAATCTDGGSYDTVIYCADCEAELSRSTTETDPLGHDYTITYTWSDDNTTVTAKAVCSRDASHNVTETATASYSEITPATSAAPGEGEYTVSFDNDLFEDQSKTVPIAQLDPDYEFVGFEWNADNTSADVIVIDRNNNDEEVRIAASMEIVETAATCTGDGSVIATASYELNGETYTESKTVVIAATGHKWKAPTWTWSADYSAATATFVCANDGTHVETKEAVITTSAVEPTCTAAGKLTFKATVTGPDGKTYTSEKSESIDALGHDYDENGVCRRCGDGGDCPWCGQHHNRKTLVGWWTELVHHVLYIINRIFLWWSAIAK